MGDGDDGVGGSGAVSSVYSAGAEAVAGITMRKYGE
jgi:hypothetical protein